MTMRGWMGSFAAAWLAVGCGEGEVGGGDGVSGGGSGGVSDGGGGGVSGGGSGGVSDGGGGGVGGSGGGSGGFGGAGGSAAGGGGGEVAAGDALAEGIAITAVSLVQGVEIPLLRPGGITPAPNAPIVAGRAGLLAVHLARAGSFAGGEVVVEALLDEAGGPRLLAQRAVTPIVDGDPSDPRSAIALPFPEDALPAAARLRLRVRRAGGAVVPDGASSPARFPNDGGFASVPSRADPAGVTVRLVPMRWDADGSGLLPDTSPATIEALRAHLQALYPVTRVTLELHEPVSFTAGLTWRGNVDFDALNSQLYDLRVDAAIPDATYLYALVRPMESYDVYCSNGCVTGQSWAVDDPADADIRNGSGVAFDAEQAAGTLAHELGHMFGRYHAPCGTSGDADYPYADAALGSWGWDARDGRFVPPDEATDFMAYCDPQWTSDYTYAALFSRVEALAALTGRGMSRPRTTLRWVHAPEGEAARLGSIVRTPLHGGTVAVRRFDASGALVDTRVARRLPRGHGGVDYLLEEPPAEVSLLSIDDPAGAVAVARPR